MARVLIVGCGCRGRSLAAALAAAGHAVRGTTRDPAKLAAVEAAAGEARLADPDRLGTVMEALTGVALVCWLMGSAKGAPQLHGDRLRTLTERLVETPVRGIVYEAVGEADEAVLAGGAAIVREAASTWRIPVEVVYADPDAHQTWIEEMTAAVGRLLAA